MNRRLSVHPGQLTIDDLLDVVASLTDDLVDRQRVSGDGSARLLRKLVRGGLQEPALRPAAALIIELERQARMRHHHPVVEEPLHG